MHRNNQWAALLICAMVGIGFYASPSYAISITHGVATGEVDSNSALIWSRTDRKATMHVQIKRQRGARRNQQRQVIVTSERDFIGKIRVDGLEPDTVYRYRVWFDNEKNKKPFRSEKMEGVFRTAPVPVAPRAVTFAWGGDVAGQNVCRDTQEGFPIFAAINRMKLDFFISYHEIVTWILRRVAECECAGCAECVYNHNSINLWKTEPIHGEGWVIRPNAAR